jgi:hypothetical protein
MGTRTSAPARRRGTRGALVVLTGFAVAVSYFAMSSLPAFSADAGTVNATVTVAGGPCITVPTTTIDFKSLGFSSPTANVTAADTLGYTSCSAAAQKVFARATDATGTAATWTLTTYKYPCTDGVNKYALDLYAGGIDRATLSATDQAIETLAPGVPGAVNLLSLTMPCQGSTGGGQTMSFQVHFTATL